MTPYTIRKVDTAQVHIVVALRKVGATVQALHTVGKGCPDLLVGFRGETYLLEVKTGSGDVLTPDELNWHLTWRGRPVAVVRSIDGALQAIGAV